MDFVFSHTSMDIWQFFQLFKYNFELYAATVSNSWYNEKALGAPVTGQDRFDGCFLLFVVMGALIMPFFLFSEAAPGLTQNNPVSDVSFDFSFIINKEVFIDLGTGDVNPNLAKDSPDYDRIQQLYVDKFCKGMDYLKPKDKPGMKLKDLPECLQNIKENMLPRRSYYPFFENKHMFLNMMDQKSFNDAGYADMTETRQFGIDQFQNAMCTKYSDEKSHFSEIVMDQLQADMKKAIYYDEGEDPKADLSINMHLNIKRNFPLTAKTVEHAKKRQMNFSQLGDCLAGKKMMPAANKSEVTNGFFNIKKQCTEMKHNHKEECLAKCANTQDEELKKKCEVADYCIDAEKRHAEGNVDYFLIKQAYLPTLMLGQSPSARQIKQASEDELDQLKDLLISIDCDYTYHIWSRHKQTDYQYFNYKVGGVNYL